MKRAILFLIVLITFLTANATDLKLKGDWGYSIDYASKTVKLTGAKLINNETRGKSGTIRLRLYLTDTKYSAGSISGYNLCEYTFDQLEGGYYYENIYKTLNFSSQPPTGSYYVTLSLAEYSDDGYVMMDYLNFEGKIAYDNTTVSDALNTLARSLNALGQSMSSYPNTYNPAPTVSIPNSQHMSYIPQKRKCVYCEGSGECYLCNRLGQSLACVQNQFGVTCSDSYCIRSNHKCSSCQSTHICQYCKGTGSK